MGQLFLKILIQICENHNRSEKNFLKKKYFSGQKSPNIILGWGKVNFTENFKNGGVGGSGAGGYFKPPIDGHRGLKGEGGG
jgi:hypothetical protein